MNKLKQDKSFEGRKIYSYELDTYMKRTYAKNINFEKSKLLNIKPFLQKNYGGDGDCSLTSMLTIVKFYKPELNTNEVYNYIEKIAKKYLYTSAFGTFFGFNKPIMKEVFKHFNIKKNLYSKYFKEIGFNADTIIKQLNNNIPILISLMDDGRNYYSNHTITIIGYKIYKMQNDENKYMFAIFDN